MHQIHFKILHRCLCNKHIHAWDTNKSHYFISCYVIQQFCNFVCVCHIQYVTLNFLVSNFVHTLEIPVLGTLKDRKVTHPYRQKLEAINSSILIQ